jgi:hypothetical protein
VILCTLENAACDKALDNSIFVCFDNQIECTLVVSVVNYIPAKFFYIGVFLDSRNKKEVVKQTMERSSIG